MSLDVAKNDIEYLKHSQEKLTTAVDNLADQVDELRIQLLEIRLGRKWLWGLLSASAVAGALIDTIARAFRFW